MTHINSDIRLIISGMLRKQHCRIDILKNFVLSNLEIDKDYLYFFMKRILISVLQYIILTIGKNYLKNFFFDCLDQS